MSINRFQIQETPQLKWFVLISMGLHIIAMVSQGLMPDEKRIETKHPAVKVKYIPPKKKTPPKKIPTFVDAPKPRKIETPKSSELIARYDSRAHSNRKIKKSVRPQNNKRVVPKMKRSKSVPKKVKPIPKKKALPEPKTTTMKKPFRQYDKGFALPKKKAEVADNSLQKHIAGGTQALLDGFDPEKYAAMDTESQDYEDDGEAISLNTKETRYASYFARIKRQIELVWGYPYDAQRKGITGQLTLRFQISRDGNLMNVRLINSSGHNVLDEAALQAVKKAAPYYPFPVTIDRENLPILANFIYSPQPAAMYYQRR